MGCFKVMFLIWSHGGSHMDNRWYLVLSLEIEMRNHSILMSCMNCVLPAGIKSQVEDTFVFWQNFCLEGCVIITTYAEIVCRYLK